MSDTYKVSFDDESFEPVQLARGENLSEHLSLDNSPVLFGCRTGICGTCMIEVSEELNGKLNLASEEERELLSVIAPGNSRARLACQIQICADIRVKTLSWK